MWAKHAKTVPKDKEDSNWFEGIMLGNIDNTREYIIGTSMGVVKTPYAPKRLPADKQWDAEAVKAVNGKPWEPVPGREQLRIPTWVYELDGEAEGEEPESKENKQQEEDEETSAREERNVQGSRSEEEEDPFQWGFGMDDEDGTIIADGSEIPKCNRSPKRREDEGTKSEQKSTHTIADSGEILEGTR